MMQCARSKLVRSPRMKCSSHERKRHVGLVSRGCQTRERLHEQASNRRAPVLHVGFLLYNLKQILAGCHFREWTTRKCANEISNGSGNRACNSVHRNHRSGPKLFRVLYSKRNFPFGRRSTASRASASGPIDRQLSCFTASSELDQYRAAHPNCCIVIGEPNILNDTFIDYITGFRKRWVQIVYKGNSTSAPGYRDAIVAVVPCGQAVYGSAMPISEDEMKLRLEEVGRKIGSAK